MRPAWLKSIGIAALIAGLWLLGYTLWGAADTTPSMKEELLENVIQEWHNAYPAAQRFMTLAEFDNNAVLDKTTGLVWEKSPQTTTVTYNEARIFCIGKEVGGQKGWRLPSPVELRSLVGPIRGLSRPRLPSNHPFLNVQPTSYWAAVSEADHGPYGKYVDTFLGNVLSLFNVRMFSFPVWCVRGPLNTDAY